MTVKPLPPPIPSAPDGGAVPAGAETIEGLAAGVLPTWDLSALYASPDDPAIEADAGRLATEAASFERRLKGTLATLDAAALAAAIEAFEAIEEGLGRLGSYASLLFSGDGADPLRGRFLQSVSERLTAIGTHLVFFTLELASIDDAALDQLIESDPALARYRPWLRDLRVFRPHLLDPAIETVLHEKEVTGRAAWQRLFDETMAGLVVPVGEAKLTVSAALNLLSDPDRAVRERAAVAIGQVLADNIRLFSLLTNTLAKDKQIVDGWRRYPRPGSYRNRSNMVEDEVVDALVDAVVADYGRTSHRYYALKARWLGLPKLQHWDRNAPLPDDADLHVPWPEARARVEAAYQAFDPRIGGIVSRFFDNPWIDARPMPGKSGGAFAHPTVPAAHPFILMNYHGRTRDVMTLAHELGHGVHQILAAGQGYLQSSTPLTLAETASVFGEMLTFRSLLDAETSPDRRRHMLAGKVEDILNTVVRQVAFYRFETRLHDARAQGELLPDEIGRIWLDVQRESLGPAFEFTPDYANYWAYVPHFVHSPFYVYAYAFGDCLVSALYATFEAAESGQADGAPSSFRDRYVEMLRAGGTLRHRELLAPFGLDAADPGFWRRGLDMLSGFIDELEREG